MKDREYIVYEGGAFTVEWYYDAKGKSQPLNFYEELDRDQKIQFLNLVKNHRRYRQHTEQNKVQERGRQDFRF